MRPTRFFLLFTLLLAVFGAGVVDVLFDDVIVIRPYTGFFVTPTEQFGHASLGGVSMETVVEIVLVIFFIGSLVAAVANRTTGITIAHTGFTPNNNLTSSPGASPILSIYPLFFIVFGLVAVAYRISRKPSEGL